jgi:galactosyltransferase
MAQLLVAVKSCRQDMDRGYHDIIRGTWGQALRGKALLRFFVGHTGGDYFMAHPRATARHLQSDEVEVDSADDYNSLPFKTRAICHWATTKVINNIFLCDTDTYVNVPKLLSCGYERYDYVGKIGPLLGETFPYEAVDRNKVSEFIPACYSWASGGYGYFLSKNATWLISDTFPKHWAEDLWVGQVLGPEIAKGNMFGLDLPAGAYSKHFPSTKFGSGYDPKFKWMEEMHAENQ